MTMVTDSFVVCSVKLCKKKGSIFAACFYVRNPSGQLAVKFFVLFFLRCKLFARKKCILYITTLYIHNSQHETC